MSESRLRPTLPSTAKTTLPDPNVGIGPNYGRLELVLAVTIMALFVVAIVGIVAFHS